MTDTTYILWIKTRENPFWHSPRSPGGYRALIDILCDMRDRYTHSRILPEGANPNEYI